MGLASKIATVVIVALLLLSVVYVFYLNGDNKETENGNNNGNNNGNGPVEDTEPPTFVDILGDTTAKKGETVTIFVIFSDNVEVTEATIYYKMESEEQWSSESILTGTKQITIPTDSNESWYYYIVLDDEAGNGPVGDPFTDGSSYYTITIVEDDVPEVEHYVFIEEATATSCSNCPSAENKLKELYESGVHKFYYLSMVEDENTVAHDRLFNDYNIYGYPTLYVDGGYKVILGDQEKSVFESTIAAAESREVPKIQVTVNVEYDNITDELLTEVLIENFENEDYSGRLRVYLTEIISRWNNYDGKPYHFAFLNYIINKDVSVLANSEILLNETYDASGLDPENLMIVAVVFSSESVQKYSNTEDNENPFNAYYADASDAAEVVEGGNLPPEVGITFPEQGKLHLGGRTLVRTLFGRTILLGRITISAYAQDDSSIAKVEFYIDNELVNTSTVAPYNYSFRSRGIIKQLLPPYKHTFSVKAYDDQGKTSSSSIEVYARI